MPTDTLKPAKHGRDHHPGGEDPMNLAAVLFIKVTSDLAASASVATGDGQFVFEVSKDMDGLTLTEVETYVTTVSSSGKPTIQLRKIRAGFGDNDILSTKCEIDANEKNSKDAAIQPVINATYDDVLWGDHIAIDVDIAGTGAKGLGVILTFRLP